MDALVKGRQAWAAGSVADAERFLERAIVLSREAGDQQTYGFAHSRLGLSRLSKSPEAAEKSYLEAVSTFEALGVEQAAAAQRLIGVYDTDSMRAEMGFALRGLALIYKSRGNTDLERSKLYYLRALALFERAQATPSQGTVLEELGDIADQQDELEAAEGYYRRAIELDPKAAPQMAERKGNRLAKLGAICLRRGNTAAARDAWQRAQATFSEAGDDARSQDMRGLVADLGVGKIEPIDRDPRLAPMTAVQLPAGKVLILTGRSLVPTTEVDPDSIMLETASRFSEDLCDVLTDSGVTALMYVQRDGAVSIEDALVRSVADGTTHAVLEVSIEHVKTKKDNTVYLKVRFIPLQYQRLASGQTGLHLSPGGSTKTFPLLSETQPDLHDAPLTGLARQLLQELREHGEIP